MATEKTELFDFWFSYSGKDKPWVETLAKVMQEQQDHIISKPDFASRFHDDVSRCRIFINRYEQQKNNKSEYRLLSGMDIGELIFDIGNDLLRAIVLSEDYFKSKICLQELCLCLCSKRCETGNYPLLLMRSVTPDKSLLEKNYHFTIPVFHRQPDTTSDTEKSEETTLPVALAKTHEYLRLKYPQGMQGFIFDELDREHFLQEIQKNLDPRLYVDCQNQSTEEIAPNVIEFSLNTVSTNRNENCFNYLHNKYQQLLENSAINRILDWCAKTFDVDMEGDFLAISDFKAVHLFLSKVNEALKILDDIRNEASNKEIIAKFCSLAIAKGFKSTKAMTLAAKSRSAGILSVNVTSTDINFKNILNAGFAYSIAHQSPLELLFDKLASNPDNAAVANLIHGQFRQRGALDKNIGDADTLFINLVDYYWPDAPNVPTSVEDAQNEAEAPFIKQLRREIEYGIDEGNFVVILMRANKDRLHSGYYTALSEIDKAINAGYDHKFHFAVVELKIPQGELPKGEFELLDDDGYARVKRILNHIFKQFKTNA